MKKAYQQLSEEIGEMKRQGAFQHTQPGGSQASHAGKMKSKRKERSGAKGDYLGREYLASRKLRNAASEGTYEDVLEQVRKGANVRTADSKGRTPLHFAACRGDANMVKLLISYGGQVNQKDCIGNTPLHLACCTNHVGVVTALLKAGTDVNAVDTRGMTPLHLAHSRLRLARESDDKGGLPLSRKAEMIKIVEMVQEYLTATNSNDDEVEELDRLAGKLSLSETTQQVEAVQQLLESFTSLTIERRQERTSKSSEQAPPLSEKS